MYYINHFDMTLILKTCRVFIVLLFTSVSVAFAQVNEAIKFKITDPNGNTDETIIRLSHDATADFDPFWDAWKLFAINDNVPSLYTNSNQLDPLAINAIPLMEKDTIVPIYMRVRVTGGSFLMETEQLGSFPNGIKIALRDVVTGDTYELDQNISFVFDVMADSNLDFQRFEVFYSTSSQVEISENNISITNPGCSEWDFELLCQSQNILITDDVQTENHLMSGLEVGNYTLIVMDEYYLSDTLVFSIEFEDDSIVEDDPIEVSGLLTQNSLVQFNIISTMDGVYIDLSDLNFEKELAVNIYSMGGQLIKSLVLKDNSVQYFDLPESSISYIAVIQYGEIIQSQKFFKN